MRRTGERGRDTFTRQGLEEYVTDAVILLDHRVREELSTRRLRIVKYRGSFHGTNEYPFLIDRHGLSVLPVTSLGLDHEAPTERLSSGVPTLDALLDGKGFYKGNTVLLSGTAGAGKTSLAASFAAAACRRGELQGRHTLQIFDLYQQPALAREEQLIAAPTLVKRAPLPRRRLVGDLSNQERVLAALGLST